MMKAPTPSISLTSWPQLAPEDYGFDGAAILRGLLLDRTGFDDEAGRQLITAAATGQVTAMVAIADRLGAAGADLTYSWLALAALHDDTPARAQLAAELMRRAFRSQLRGDRREAARLGVVAARWFLPLASDLATAFGPARTSLAKAFVEAGAIPPQPAAAEDSVAEPVGAVIVLPRGVPLQRGDRDDRALAEAWKPLTKPLPVAPGLRADLLTTVLDLEFPWMAAATAAIAGDLRLRQALGAVGFHLRPLLLVGPPGCGKTAFAHRIATLSGVASEEIRAGGSSDNRLLAGTARGWSTAQPGLVLQVIRRAGIANPLMIVDEIDKAHAGSRNGDIRHSLLALTEPETARAWMDECLCSPADLSRASWVLTANEVDPLRGPLLTRLRVVQVPSPGLEHFDALLMGIRRVLARRLGLAFEQVPLPDDAVAARLRSACRRGISLRRLLAAYERYLLGLLSPDASAGPWKLH